MTCPGNLEMKLGHNGYDSVAGMGCNDRWLHTNLCDPSDPCVTSDPCDHIETRLNKDAWY